MNKNHVSFRKMLVICIIVLFISICFLPTISGKKEKCNIIISGIDDGLVGYWSFNEASGNIVLDDSGNGNDGTIFDAQWVTGVSGSALSFDGLDDYIDYTDPILNTPPYSICVWVKPDSINYGYIIDNGGGYNYGYGFYILINETGYWWFGGKRQDTYHGSVRYQTPSTDWTFVCGTWDGEDVNNLKLYINGQLVSGNIYTYPDPGAEPFNLKIGTSIFNMNNFGGDIDEVRIYNRILNDAEIEELYNNPDGLKKTIIFGKIDNPNIEGNFITFEAEKLRCIQFSPFQILQFTAGERIRVSVDCFGIITLKKAFGFFNSNI
jgi:hypothetical protein